MVEHCKGAWLLVAFWAIAMLVVAFSANGCASTLSELPISDETKIELAVTAGCIASASAGCLDESEVEGIIGVVRTSEQCISAVTEAVESGTVSIDLDALTSKNMTCRRFLKGLGL